MPGAFPVEGLRVDGHIDPQAVDQGIESPGNVFDIDFAVSAVRRQPGAQVPDLTEITLGQLAAERQIAEGHFPAGFDLAPVAN